jgi:hypothetical protein
MAMITFGGVGSSSVASGVVTYQDTIILDAQNFVSEQLEVAQLPHLFFWVKATAALNITPEIAVRGTPTLDWQALSSPIAVAPGVPTLVDFRFPARFMRISFNAPAIAGSVTYILAACSGV